MTAGEAVRLGMAALERAGVDSARLDAELLVGFVLGWDRAGVYTHPERELSAAERSNWRALLDRRRSREPLPYLLGEWEFYGRKFEVTPATLIPRPETELLVEGLLARGPWGARPLIADVGTGTGCIGLTLAADVPDAILILTDSSADTLAVTRRNADRLGLAGRVEIRHAAFPDGLDDLAGRLDALVSNPPYVADRDHDILPPEVAKFEPAEALFAGDDGLDMLAALLLHGRRLLGPGGRIALEFGIGQAPSLISRAAALGYQSLSIERDLAGIPRALFARSP